MFIEQQKSPPSQLLHVINHSKSFLVSQSLSQSNFEVPISVPLGVQRWLPENTGFSSNFLVNTELELESSLLAVRSEKKRLRKPSKWLLEYTEEYDQIFAPKKKQKKVQEQVHQVCSNISVIFR